MADIKRKFDPFLCREAITSLDKALEEAKPKVKDDIQKSKDAIVNICRPTSTKEVKALLKATSQDNRTDKQGEFYFAAGVPYPKVCKGKWSTRKNRGGKQILKLCEGEPNSKDWYVASVRFHPDLYEVRKIRDEDAWKISRKPPQGSSAKPDESTWFKLYGPLVYDEGYMRFKDIAEANHSDHTDFPNTNTKPKYFL